MVMLTSRVATVGAPTIWMGLKIPDSANPNNTITGTAVLNWLIENLTQKQSSYQSFLEHYQSISLKLVYSLPITVRL